MLWHIHQHSRIIEVLPLLPQARKSQEDHDPHRSLRRTSSACWAASKPKWRISGNAEISLWVKYGAAEVVRYVDHMGYLHILNHIYTNTHLYMIHLYTICMYLSIWDGNGWVGRWGKALQGQWKGQWNFMDDPPRLISERTALEDASKVS